MLCHFFEDLAKKLVLGPVTHKPDMTRVDPG